MVEHNRPSSPSSNIWESEKKEETLHIPLHVFLLSCLLHYYRGVATGEVGEKDLGMKLCVLSMHLVIAPAHS